jgi:hypothetical protein
MAHGPVMDISKLINILSQHGKHVTELMDEIGFTGENTLQAKLLKGIVTVFNPDLTVIYDILNYNPDNTKLQEQRKEEFADIIRKRDTVCWVTGRYAERCEVAHIYEYKDCKDTGDRYNINNGILLDAGLHKLWDINEIIFEPLTESSAQFKINPYSIALEHDIPELLIPIEISNITPEMMKFIKMRNYSH